MPYVYLVSYVSVLVSNVPPYKAQQVTVSECAFSANGISKIRLLIATNEGPMIWFDTHFPEVALPLQPYTL